jgi:hypothetical protein
MALPGFRFRCIAADAAAHHTLPLTQVEEPGSMSMTKPIKFVLACLLCLGVITGMVLLIRWLF